VLISQLADKSLFISDSFLDGEWFDKDRKFDVYGMHVYYNIMVRQRLLTESRTSDRNKD